MKAGSTGKYFIYQRTIKESVSGKPVKAWYYWYYTEAGARTRRSCGSARVPCLLKREAEAFIAALEAEEQERAMAMKEAATAAQAVRFRDIAADMYIPGSKHMKLRVERGESLTDITMAECRGYLENWILPKWGDWIPSTIEGAMIEDWLIEIDRSNSFRNRALEIMNEAFSECLRYKVLSSKPAVRRFRRANSKRDILSLEEINLLFPDDARALAEVWRYDDPREPRDAGLMFGTINLLMLSTGIRVGEAIAIRPAQIDRSRSGLILDRSYDSWHRITEHLKKGDDDDRRLRSVIIPKRAMRALDWWMEASPPESAEGLLFQHRGRSLRRELIEARFSMGLQKMSICDIEGRRLTPHALRYTYNTRMGRLIPGNALRDMMGHRDEEMTIHYTRAELEAQLDSLQQYRPAIELLYA